MNTALLIHSNRRLVFEDFLTYMEMPNLVLDFISELPDSIHWYFHREGTSTTLFAVNYNLQGTYEVSIDNLASYNDLKFFPYLIDSLAKFLSGTLDLENIYEELNEEWIEETIAEDSRSPQGVKGAMLRLPRCEGSVHVCSSLAPAMRGFSLYTANRKEV